MTHPHATHAIDRLRTLYASRVLLPRSDGRHTPPCEEMLTGFCTCTQDYRLGLNLLHRLFRAVVSEHQE